MRAKRIAWAAAGIVLGGLVLAVAVKVVRQQGLFEPEAQRRPATMRLISAKQYINTVHYVFGEDIDVTARFPLMQRRQGLVSLGSATAVMTSGALEQFDRAARSIATQVNDEAHRRILVPCTPRTLDAPDANCARSFFTQAGRLLFRRPLTAAELESYVAIAGTAAATVGDFYDGLASGLAGMLMAPQFLYITESTEPDPDHPGQYRLDAYSKASRLSLLLWNALPDDALLTAAAAGEFDDSHRLAHQVDRMLASSRLEQGVRAFFEDLLRMQEFETISKDAVIYPSFTFNVAQATKEQMLRMVTDRLLVQHGDYRDLFTSNRTFVNRSLAPLYQASISSGSEQDWIPHALNAGQSAGLLTSLNFLGTHAHPGRSSPTRRGMAIREIFLCQAVPEPPPTVDFASFEKLSGHQTARDRLAAHSTDPVCKGCHKLTDPAGLALENFDGAGRFRTRENDTQIDASGEFDGKPFTGASELGQALRDHPALAPCLTRRLFAYGIGSDPGKSDREWLAWIAKRFAVNRYRLPELLKEMGESEGFYAVSAPDDVPGVAAKVVSADAAHVAPGG